ncbi:SGNH/GDSL hydrolase family protein [Halalkalibacter akibai]|uniref:Putative Cap64-like protein n=1 Tax=Halalkalibacter akibai (strain ATCC 43226 / DSM 21942 / CIP 109018 / JCM 9157 / 1139) TaxID=1236973 RepID=W4QVE2_HALA3|nr:SGNH/GDSL hydrolase family protein [Halalkalibacter akibai]GAE36115.1 putative Cap64-like protein [Halalkalibacter akibai JCM 9157]
MTEINGSIHTNIKFKAPKDPVERRSSFYLMFETDIEATSRTEGSPSQEIYLEGEQLLTKARLTGGVTDEEILKLLANCKGFHNLVHSIGVVIETGNNYNGNINFVLQNWGKEKKYETGTLLRIPCPTDGTERVMKLEEFQWSADDDVLGKIAFEFDQPGQMAKVSVRFYLNDGYEVPEIEVEAPVPFNSDAYRTMISKSLLSKGNNKRLKAAIEKAERGEEVTIAYIGGSITQGAGAKPIHTNCYAYQSYLKFKEMFGKDKGENVHFVKAGVGGTPSQLGIIRYDRDILRNETVEPDIIIVEFAVNDAGDETKGICYESLCLKILTNDHKPAVILLFSVFENDWNLQERLSPVGLHYELPMVSVKDAVVDQFRLPKGKGKIISKRQFFYDIYHPTNDGHMIMADCLSYLFSEIKKSETDKNDITLDKTPVIGNDFTDIQLLDRKEFKNVATVDFGGFSNTDLDLQMVEMDANPLPTPQFPNNWMHTAASGEESFKMTINCRSLMLVFKDSGSSEFGKADIFVDGQHVRTADPHENNWTHCNAVILYQENVSKEHLVEIKMASGDSDKCFTILGFGYTL